jgi:hypothetical protein
MRSAESYLKAGGNTRLNASKNARYDLAGSATNFANQTLTYNNRGRLASDLVGTNNSTHVYNALGQMIHYNFGSINSA